MEGTDMMTEADTEFISGWCIGPPEPNAHPVYNWMAPAEKDGRHLYGYGILPENAASEIRKRVAEAVAQGS